MNKTKSWFQSKTIWAILIGALALGMKALGVTDPALPESTDVTQVVGYIDTVKAAHGSIAALWPVVIGFGSLLFGIISRVKADTKIV